MRQELAPGKSLGKQKKVHYGVRHATCGKKGVGLLIADDWSVVDCQACVRVFGAAHDKPCR